MKSPCVPDGENDNLNRAENLSLLIVDDEVLTRSLLRNCLDWRSLGIQIAGEAADAEEGFVMVKSLKPDIVLTDIRMGRIDGINFGGMIKADFPDMRVVIITGYDEFEYAQRSIKLGIDDFIMKPVDAREIAGVFSRIANQIAAERRKAREVMQLREVLERNREHIRDWFILELVRGAILSSQEVADTMAFFDLPWRQAGQVALVEIRDIAGPRDAATRLLSQLRRSRALKQHLLPGASLHVAKDLDDLFIVLHFQEDPEIFERYDELVRSLSADENCQVTVGIGEYYDGWESAFRSCQEARDALDLRNVRGRGKVYGTSDLALPPAAVTLPDSDQPARYPFLVRAGAAKRACEVVEQAFIALRRGTRSLEGDRAEACAFVSELSTVLVQAEINGADIQDRGLFLPIFECTMSEDIENYVRSLTIRAVEIINSRKTVLTSALVEKSIMLIKDNLFRYELSLNYVAEQCGVTPSYLSRTLHRGMGITYKEYVTRERMAAAINLLRDTDLFASQIAEKVGFFNPSHFYEQFKKYTGINITDYRKQFAKKTGEARSATP
jgi:two-component system response regulator YesN